MSRGPDAVSCQHFCAHMSTGDLPGNLCVTEGGLRRRTTAFSKMLPESYCLQRPVLRSPLSRGVRWEGQSRGLAGAQSSHQLHTPPELRCQV